MEKALFINEIAQLKNFEGYDRIYFGSEFCERLIPTKEELIKVLNLVEKNNLEFTFMTSFVTDYGLDLLCPLFNELSKRMMNAEIIINDWGVWNYVKKNYNFSNLVLGRLLNKQKRGPRIMNFLKDLPQADLERFRECAVVVKIFRDFLIKKKFIRVELDNLLQGIKTDLAKTNLKGSLYYPYVYVSTTRHCLTNFSNDPVKSHYPGILPCKKQCKLISFSLKNKAMPVQIIIKGNTQYFVNKKIPEDLEEKGIDRIVYQL